MNISNQKDLIPDWLILIFFFALSVLVRIPNLNRPLSKHHEFNTAVILICLESWDQAGGASNFNFIPVLNYQNPGDKAQVNINTDNSGNMMYLSFGPGWYIIPYVVFKSFSVTPSPLSLQILNIIFNFFTVLLFYRLLSFLFISSGISNRKFAVAGTIVFLFQPATLWFLGNGYVHTGIILPFIIVILHEVIAMHLDHSHINPSRLALIFISGLLLLYIDWFGIFLMTVTGLSTLFHLKKSRKYWSLIIISFLTMLTGILLILVQFSSYVGWEKVKLYLTERFFFRGITNESNFTPLAVVNYFQFLIMGFFPAVAAMILALFIINRNRIFPELPFPIRLAVLLSLVTCVVDNILLFNWSSNHDFALMPYIIPISIFVAYLLSRLPSYKMYSFILAGTLLTGIIQYYLVNRPGKVSQNGMPYNEYRKIGQQINKIVTPDQKIYGNTSYFIYTFYAKRNITPAGNYEQAVQQSKRDGVRKSVWIKIDEFKDHVTISEVKEINFY